MKTMRIESLERGIPWKERVREPMAVHLAVHLVTPSVDSMLGP